MNERLSNEQLGAAHVSPEAIEAASAAKLALEGAKAYPAIKTESDMDKAADELKSIKAQGKRLEEMRVSLKAPVLEASRRIDEFFKQPIAYCADAEKAIKKQIATYTDEQERIRKEAQRQAEEASRKERERLAAEAAKQEEAARAAREKAEREAAALRDQGKEERAAAVLERAEERAEAKESQAQALRVAADTMPTRPLVPGNLGKPKGVSTPERWGVEQISKTALIKAVAAGLVPEEYLDVNMSFANKMVSALKGGFNVPGLRAVRKTSVSVRA